MNIDTLLRAAEILRSQPAYSMPLVKLYSRLAEDLGNAAGTYAQVYRELKKRPQSFMVIDSPRLVEDAKYEDALDDTGLGACVRVALAEFAAGAPGNSLVALAAASLSELWQRQDLDPVIRDYLVRATRDLEDMSFMLAAAATRPTILPRDPLP